MRTEDKIQILVANFKKKFGTNPTCVLLPEVTQNKLLGLLIKPGERLAVGVGNQILFWNIGDEPKKLSLFVQPESKSIFKLIEEYDTKQVSLYEVLNAIVDFEQGRRTQSL